LIVILQDHQALKKLRPCNNAGTKRKTPRYHPDWQTAPL